MTIFTTANVAEITEATRAMLEDALAVRYGSAANVERAGEPNESPDRCPWVGVYRTRLSLPPRTLGAGSGFRTQRVTLVMVMNETSTETGAVCEDRLEALVQCVLSALCTDQSLRGTVLTLEDIDIAYSTYTAVGNAFFQEAVVTVTAITFPTAS